MRNMADLLPRPPKNTNALATGSHKGVDGVLFGIHPEGSDYLVGADGGHASPLPWRACLITSRESLLGDAGSDDHRNILLGGKRRAQPVSLAPALAEDRRPMLVLRTAWTTMSCKA